ncbi:DUF4175 domain-containing protein [Thalassospira marina]|uniref:TIGR02302 family protein n=1 Tax=Thalassospira marina TaxID=2048283 RepID=A0ABN5FHS7_9PROT|nr:DUF4175 family protein [Thalassospira marina]AUG54192.1 hypothetical protein CSC3H3_16785 [Thalassospira marina]
MLVTSARLERRLKIARHILTWERVWPRLIPVLAIIATVFGLALTGILAHLPPLVHIGILALAFVGIGVCAAFVWRALRTPGAIDVMARLEAENNLRHTPIQSQLDAIAPTEDALTSYLWQRQLRINEASTDNLRLPRPRAVLAKMDPFGLSVIPVLLLFVGILSAHGKYADRLVTAFDPISRLGTARFATSLWITPPAYTGKIPRTIDPTRERNIIYVTALETGLGANNRTSATWNGTGTAERDYGFGSTPDGNSTVTGTERDNNASAGTSANNGDTGNGDADGTANQRVRLRVPAGTILSGSITSAWEPTLISPDGHERAFGEENGNNTYTISTPLDLPGEWNVTVWGTSRLTLTVDIIPDLPPILAFVAPPSATKRDHVHLDYIANDDYGLRKLALVISPRLEASPAGVYGKTDDITINLTGPLDGNSDDNVKSASHARDTQPLDDTAPVVNNLHGPYFLNLVDHAWAGLPVNLQLVAVDNAGQSAKSEIQSMVLPEREFTHPVARKLIDIRKFLLRYPERAREWRDNLYPVLNAPQAYGGDIGVFLGLSVATARLSAHLDDIAYHHNVGDLLWHIAEEIERGQYGLAERNLIDAEEKLLEALSNPDISEQEISDLIERYRQALNEYMSALAQQDQPQRDQNAPQGKMIEQQDLSRVIDQISALMRSGARNDARNLIEQLRQLVENMQVSTDGQGQEITRPLRQMLDGMRDLARRQQELMDQGDQRNNDVPSSQDRAQTQQQLSDDASALTKNESFDRFGQSSGLQSAIDAMTRASEALAHGRQHEALQQQQQALQSLREGIGALGQALEGLSKMMPMFDEMGTSGQRDPLGRPVDGSNGTNIPDADTLNQTWRILQELRRRSSDPERPKIEHDYIDRLLKRF